MNAKGALFGIAAALALILLWGHCSQAQAAELTKAELIAQIRAKVAEQAKELEFADRKAREAILNSDRTHEELGRAQQQANQVGVERDQWKAYGDDQHDKWINAEKRVAQQHAKALRLWIILIVLVTINLAYAFAKFYLRVPFL